MEIALEMPALGVTRLHRPGARRGELLARIGVRERLGDKLGEALEALLGALGQRFPTDVGDGERAPDAAVSWIGVARLDR